MHLKIRKQQAEKKTANSVLNSLLILSTSPAKAIMFCCTFLALINFHYKCTDWIPTIWQKARHWGFKDENRFNLYLHRPYTLCRKAGKNELFRKIYLRYYKVGKAALKKQTGIWKKYGRGQDAREGTPINLSKEITFEARTEAASHRKQCNLENSGILGEGGHIPRLYNSGK